MRDEADLDDGHEMNKDPGIDLAEMRAFQCRNDMAKSVAAVCAEAHRVKEEIPDVTPFKLQDGTEKKINMSDTMKPKYIDEYTLEDFANV